MVSSTVKFNQELGTELHPSPKLVVALLLILALIISLSGDDWLGPAGWSKVMPFALLLYVAAGIIWILDDWRPQWSRWGSVVVLVMTVDLGLMWLDMPGFLAAIAFPIVLAAALLGVPAAIITTTAQTILLLLLTSYIPLEATTSTILTLLLAIWVILGLMYFVYHPVNEIIEWSWEHYENAQNLLEEARDRKVELAQTLDALALANRELVLLNERVATMRLIAEEAQKAKTAFVAKVSHEFRTPLNMIIGLTDILLEKPEVVYGNTLPEPLLEDLKIVHRNCEHLSSMVNDVLDLSQTELGRLTLHREWVDLGQEINAAVTVVRPLLEKKELGLQVNIPEDLPQVYCDRTRIRQVILNLVSNASRYTQTGGIIVSANQQNRYVAVSVADTGPGIAPDDVEKIFDPFFQAGNNLWRDQGGSGLGLSISKQFVERHEGEIWLESEPGVGSTFSFKIPISLLSPSTARPGRWIDNDWVFRERTAWPKVPTLPYKQRVVLCDETGNLHALFAGYGDEIEFIDTKNLAQASEAVQDFPAHAVILNSEPAANLALMIDQARQQIPDTPVIGCSLPIRVDHTLKTGAIGRLIKPVRQADLEEVLQTIETPVKRVLVVDDNPDVLQLFKRMLHIYNEAWEVVLAANGEEALQQLHTHPPDLVLLDIILPDVNGWQILEQKERDEATRDIPVIVVSAEDLVEQATSDLLVASMGEGLSVNQVMRCSLQLSKLLFEPG
ncbi:MAG: hybrid sensor histidine kinase/response regulator [Anaerolineae bacterium]|nr:hybrid sensor histidine kinase/response regulator [Anaerolineae bacterium]